MRFTLAIREPPPHAVTVWRVDLAGTRWAWGCRCGTRKYDLANHNDASVAANAHINAHVRGERPIQGTA